MVKRAAQRTLRHTRLLFHALLGPDARSGGHSQYRLRAAVCVTLRLRTASNDDADCQTGYARGDADIFQHDEHLSICWTNWGTVTVIWKNNP
jgi:hypothetical protein